LLLCEKAFGYCYAEEDLGYDINFNKVTKKVTVGGKARLETQIVQKLYHGHRGSDEFRKLGCRDYTPIPVTKVDGIQVVDS
ncbi:hypothetical protein IMZ48_29480, partial [Candidatus Bathyarchaeota archaeon]|nr:hypothetical protein [Candidatus Bathyarchaeota archaeon]